MFTVCPKCALTLVVTAADLRVAQGYVRCGRCSNVFNALARLSEDRQAAAPAQSGPQPAAREAPTSRPSDKAPEARPSQTSKLRQPPDPPPPSSVRQAADPSPTSSQRQPVATAPASS